MASTKIKIKTNKYAIRTDYINITVLLSIATLCIVQMFHITSAIFFLIDVPIVLIIMKNIKGFESALRYKPLLIVTLTLAAALITMLIGGLINYVSVKNIIYGIYKYYRGFVFFYCVIAFVDKDSVEQTLGMFKSVFYINFALSLFQFFVLGTNQDLLGGIFGTVVGNNQYTNLLFVIISVYCIDKIINHDANRKENNMAVAFLFFMFIIAALAEIKFFFAEFVLLLAVAYLFSQKKINSIIYIVLVVGGVVACYNLLLRYFPQFTTLVSELKVGGLVRLRDLQRHYSTDYDIGRAVVFSYSNQYLLPKSINHWLGMGIGNVSSSNLTNNEFWLKNQETHYDQFYTAYLYNEQGLVGFSLYCLIYIGLLIIGISALRNKKTKKYGLMLILMIVGCMMIFAYNMALYSQLNFIMFWALAVLTKLCCDKKFVDNWN